MNAEEMPGTLLESWERLSLAETEAIEARNWGHLATLQDAKAALRQQLEHVDFGVSSSHPEWASRVVELLEQERANLALVMRCQAAAAEERATMERARWNLRRQMGSFGHRAPTFWQQYS